MKLVEYFENGAVGRVLWIAVDDLDKGTLVCFIEGCDASVVKGYALVCEIWIRMLATVDVSHAGRARGQAIIKIIACYVGKVGATDDARGRTTPVPVQALAGRDISTCEKSS